MVPNKLLIKATRSPPPPLPLTLLARHMASLPFCGCWRVVHLFNHKEEDRHRIVTLIMKLIASALERDFTILGLDVMYCNKAHLHLICTQDRRGRGSLMEKHLRLQLRRDRQERPIARHPIKLSKMACSETDRVRNRNMRG